MPATVEKVQGYPIFKITYYGHITVSDAKNAIQRVCELRRVHGAPLYKIVYVDCDNAHTSFDEVMMLTTLSSKGICGSASDPDVHMALVGEHLLIDLYADAMRQEAFGGVEIPIFDTLESAEQYIHECIHRQSGRV